MGPKGGHIRFGESDIGDSIVDGPQSIIGFRGTQPAGPDKNNSRVSKQIQQVVIEEEEPAIDMTKKKGNGTAPPPLNKPMKADEKKAGNKKDNMKLTVGEDNKRKK